MKNNTNGANHVVKWEDRPVVNLTEAIMITGLSASSLKRRIKTGQIKAIDRSNIHERLLIHTDSLTEYLNGGK